MMKLKTTLFLFTVFLLGAAAPKAFLDVRSGHKDLKLLMPKISFHLPVFETQTDKTKDNQSFIKLSDALTKSYQREVYSQWQGPSQSEKTEKAPTKVKKVVSYAKEPDYRYRSVQAQKGEINNKELIQHYGFQVERPKVARWSSSYDSSRIAMTLDKLNDSEVDREIAHKKEDQVDVRQAAILENEHETEKNKKEFAANEMDDETWEEELVMIDYSDDSDEQVEQEKAESSGSALSTQEAMQLLAKERPNTNSKSKGSQTLSTKITSMSDDLTQTEDIPASVMSAISREMSKRESIPTVATVNTQKDEYSHGPAATTTQAPSASGVNTQEKAEYSHERKVSGRSLNNVSIHEVLVGEENSMRELRNFEFFAETLYGESHTDNSEGEVTLDFDLSSSMGVLRGTILKHGYMRTKVDLVLESGKYDVQIPMIEQDTFSRFLDHEGIYGRGGYVLVRLPQRADTVEIDAGYETKIYLNENFKVVDQNDYYEFVLFAGVDPGNILLSYKNINEKVADKISHVVEDEVLFDSGILVDSEQLSFSLEEKNMLSRKNSSVDIHPDQINYFNRRTQASQQAVSNYSIQTPLRSLGMRDYLEMRHTQLPIFVGLWSNNKVELPSESFAYYIMESHQLNSLQNACMVQINLSKPLRDAQFFGETKRGPMGVVQSYLDQDGEFNYDPSEMASHIFLVGDLQGTISGKLEYVDGTHDFIQTFCSNNTYLVEQL